MRGVFIPLIAELAWLIARHEKRLALSNLDRFITAGDRRQARNIARSMCAHLAMSLIECLELWRGAQILNNVSYAPGSREILEAALAEGRGCVMLTGHIGNWELMAARYVDDGFPTATFIKKSYDPRLDRLVSDFRSRYGIVSIDRDAQDAGQRALELLKQKYLLGALIDQDTRISSVDAAFFGASARTPGGPAALALKSGAALVCGYIARKGKRHEISIYRIDAASQADRSAAIFDIATQANAIFETAIRRHPEQWVWFHRRWR